MRDTRPQIPRPLQRQVKVEAGHRCAIPTCRQTSGLEIHHIDDWAKVKEHVFGNLILLCAVCHHRATLGEIDRLAMLQYKANLEVLSNRYGDVERRALQHFIDTGGVAGSHMTMGGDPRLAMSYLVRDGIVEESSVGPRLEGNSVILDVTFPDTFPIIPGPPDGDASQVPTQTRYTLTPRGAEMLLYYTTARSIE